MDSIELQWNFFQRWSKSCFDRWTALCIILLRLLRTGIGGFVERNEGQLRWCKSLNAKI